jgi:mRNA interferase MazF
VRRGEIWWVGTAKVVLLSGAEEGELRAMEIVPPATAAEKQGFVLLSGEEAADSRARDRIVAAAGIEIDLGLPDAGVVRVALPRDGQVFCTWLLTLTPGNLHRKIGTLSPGRLRQLDNALRLAAIE